MIINKSRGQESSYLKADAIKTHMGSKMAFIYPLELVYSDLSIIIFKLKSRERARKENNLTLFN